MAGLAERHSWYRNRPVASVNVEVAKRTSIEMQTNTPTKGTCDKIYPPLYKNEVSAYTVSRCSTPVTAKPSRDKIFGNEVKWKSPLAKRERREKSCNDAPCQEHSLRMHSIVG